MNKYEKYAQIKRQIKELETVASLLNKDIIEELSSQGKKTEKTEYGTFTVATKKTWKYSKAVDELSEQLKIKQIEEQEKGIAKVKESSFLMFK